MLADLPRLGALFDLIIKEMDLHPIGETAWYQFPTTGGLTGLSLLAIVASPP